jgi:hypothetical protein
LGVGSWELGVGCRELELELGLGTWELGWWATKPLDPTQPTFVTTQQTSGFAATFSEEHMEAMGRARRSGTTVSHGRTSSIDSTAGPRGRVQFLEHRTGAGRMPSQESHRRRSPSERPRDGPPCSQGLGRADSVRETRSTNPNEVRGFRRPDGELALSRQPLGKVPSRAEAASDRRPSRPDDGMPRGRRTSWLARRTPRCEQPNR